MKKTYNVSDEFNRASGFSNEEENKEKSEERNADPLLDFLLRQEESRQEKEYKEDFDKAWNDIKRKKPPTNDYVPPGHRKAAKSSSEIAKEAKKELADKNKAKLNKIREEYYASKEKEPNKVFNGKVHDPLAALQYRHLKDREQLKKDQEKARESFKESQEKRFQLKEKKDEIERLQTYTDPPKEQQERMGELRKDLTTAEKTVQAERTSLKVVQKEAEKNQKLSQTKEMDQMCKKLLGQDREPSRVPENDRER